MNSIHCLKIAAVLGGLGLCLCGGSSNAAEGPQPGKGPPQKTIADRPVVIPSDAPGEVRKPEHPKRPDSPDRPENSPGVKEMVRTFTETRNAFLAEQAQLRENLKKATEQDRQAIRDQIREGLNEWIALQKQRIRDDITQRRDTRGRIPDLDEVVRDSVGEGRGR